MKTIEEQLKELLNTPEGQRLQDEIENRAINKELDEMVENGDIPPLVANRRRRL